MRSLPTILVGSPRTLAIVACVSLAASLQHADPGASRAPSLPRADGSRTDDEVIAKFCVRCHGKRKPKAGLTLKDFSVEDAAKHADVAEKMVRKLRAGLMPPAGAKRPEQETLDRVAGALEKRLDAAAEAAPNPGRRSFQRLNRAEYRRSIRDLLGLDVDVAAFLPPDTISHGFDNIADMQALSPTLMSGYLRAASEISRLAVGNPEAGPSETTFKVPRTASQVRHVEGTPFGTRGGIAVVHNFPADGEYVVKIQLHSGPTGFLFGLTARGQQLEVSVNGVRVALLDINTRMHERNPTGMMIETKPILMRAGPQRVAAAFLKKREGPVEDLIAPIEHTLADTMIGADSGITTVPHVRDMIISGPYKATGISETPSRQRIFTRRPDATHSARECAEEILTQLARRAYRRPVDARDLEGLMRLYDEAAEDEAAEDEAAEEQAAEKGTASGSKTMAGFEAGVRTALQAILTSPHFVFRIERAPAGTKPDTNYKIRERDLASRLSYFLWASVPDDELATLADQRRLRDPKTLAAQVTRMLADPRGEAMASRFAAQWFRLQDLAKVHPDALAYPQFDQRLSVAMRRETELLFEYLVRENRSALELLTADYTFVNERLGRHYGMSAVAGPEFRKVAIRDPNRRGLLGHGSILTLTSHANRTSPVLRGKWVLEVLLGSPPPAPPPTIPDFEETAKVSAGRLRTVRERLAEHRSNRSCKSCHDMIDPIGLALENFDVTGVWRIKDGGTPIDAKGELYDGTPLNGPADLRQALLGRKETFVRNLIENLMTYALGRRLEHYDLPSVRTIARDAAANNYRMSDILLGVVRSPAFQMARAEPKQPKIIPKKSVRPATPKAVPVAGEKAPQKKAPGKKPPGKKTAEKRRRVIR